MEPIDRLDRWKRSLLDLTLRNRLIDARDGARCVALAGGDPVALAAAIDGGAALDVVAIGPEAAGAPAGVALEAQRVLVALTGDELARRLAIMARAMRESLAEGGTHTLWLGLGMLRWLDDDGAAHRAPIALVPVVLARAGAGQGYRIVGAGDDARVNETLVEKLRVELGVVVEAEASVEVDGDAGEELDVTRTIARFGAAVAGRAGWGVEHAACLGVFSFAKLVMWTDLAERAERLAAGPVAHHLAFAAGAPFADQGSFVDPATLDELPVADTLVPLDCDASQLAAVLAGADGKTFVLQGPPGTGKSQTIANLIAVAITRGKTVLFVSEKMAALEVVERRLAQVGLAGSCLELHSHKARRKDVVEQLGKVLKGSWRPASGVPGDDERLGQARAALDGHVRAMHAVGPLGLSLHDALARLVELRAAARLADGADPTSIADAAAFAAARAAIADYARAAEGVMTSPTAFAEHPWRASTLATWQLMSGDEVGDAVRAVAAAADEMIACLAAWAEAVPGLSARTAADVDAMGRLWGIAARTARPGAELITAAPSAAAPAAGPDGAARNDRFALAKARAQNKALEKTGPPRDVIGWLAAARIQAELARRLAARWTDALDGLDLDALAVRFRKWAGRFSLLRWLALRGARRDLRRALAAEGAALPDDLAVAADLDAAIEERRVRRALDDARPQAARWLGALSPAEDEPVDLAQVDAAIAWSSELRAAFDAAPYQGPGDRLAREAAWKALVAQVAAPPSTRPGRDDRDARDTDVLLGRSAAAYAAWQAALVGLARTAGVETTAFDGAGLAGGVAAALARAAAIWKDTIPALRDWSAYVRARTAAEARGLGAACAVCEAGAVSPAALPEAWERAVVLAWADAQASAQAPLRDFHGAAHHARVTAFAELDRSSLSVARARSSGRLAERVPRADQDPSGEIGVLLREVKKQRGHRPLRRLFRELPGLLPRLKPCLLMSPLSVAQYLDPALPRFDLVIFDEASQIPTADAIGALARGAAAVIVGDSRQLPPTRFFASGGGEDDDDDVLAGDVVELESVLDECVAARLPELHLRWHYRSRHEDLIAFSNARYYDDRLHVFPSAARGPDLGVELRPVAGGVYDRAGTRTNRVEAEAVVAEIAARVRAGKRSIGVVTFSRPQQALVEDLLDDARALDPALDAAMSEAAEPVIVKNLETVQGDERDLVILSVGYGPDADGAVTMNFGPLNQNGGERRLNVAVTRAREKLIVFSSLAPEAIATSGVSVGVRHLGELLAYARRASASATEVASDAPAPAEPSATAITAAIARALEARGWVVKHQVGCAAYRIDLAVVDPDDPGRYVLGVEADGPAYAQAATARDRDRLRALVLGGLGWRLHRVWALDWWADPDKEIQRLHSAVFAAVAAVRAARTPRTRPVTAPRSAARGVAAAPAAAAPTAVPGSAPTAVPDAGPAPAPDSAPAAARDSVPFARGSSPTPTSTPALSPPLAMPAIGRYIAASVPAGRRTADELYQPRYADEVGNLIGAVLAAEAPVHVDLLARRVGAYFGIGRVTGKVTDRLRELLGARGVFGGGDDADVVWRADQDPGALPGVRVAGDAAETRRDIDEVPVAELAAAAAIVLHRTTGAPVDDLVRDAARLLGFARVTERISKRVRAGVDALIARGGCVLEGERAALP